MGAATERQYTWKEIENELPLTRAWAEKMEVERLLPIKSPKGKGRIERVFDRVDVVNMLWLWAFRAAGFTPEHLRSYRKLVMRFHKIIRKYQKGVKDRWEHAPVFLFHIEDFFPQGIDAVDWNQITPEDLILIKGYLDEALSYVIDAKKLIKEYRQRTELTLRSLDEAEERLGKYFIKPVKNVLFDKLQYGGKDSRWRMF
jgi:hypothetical protein